VEEHLPHYAASVSEVKAAKEQIDEYFRTLVKQARDLAALSGVTLEATIRQGHEVETIVNMAKEGKFDLLIAGYHGHSGIFGRIMGSTAQSIVRLAPCHVLLTK
jgi:nucleotide-binding universal stress UspA family protein